MDPMTAITAPEFDNHLALGLAESAACNPTDGERWLDAVEALLGHDIDGDQATDGYSIDAFVVLWQNGRTPEQAIAEVGEVEV